jgi:hypothetical protein
MCQLRLEILEVEVKRQGAGIFIKEGPGCFTGYTLMGSHNSDHTGLDFI